MDTAKVFVLDEADKMVDEKSLGADTLKIKKMLHPDAQVLLFSATYSKEVLDYARKIVPRYVFKLTVSALNSSISSNITKIMH